MEYYIKQIKEKYKTLQHKYPPLYHKAKNWNIFAKYLYNKQHVKSINEWFKLKNGKPHGFSIHFTAEKSKLDKKVPRISGTKSQLTSLYKDILRRMNEGKFKKKKFNEIIWFSPIYMLTKIRSYVDPSLGFKDRTIFNNSAKTGKGDSLNDHVPDEHRKMQFINAINQIKIKIELAKSRSPTKECYMAKFDLENGFENLFIPENEQPYLGTYIQINIS